MATLIRSFSFAHTSDAQYRAWIKHVYDALIEVGAGMLTRTEDTGQVNFDTAARPGANVRNYFNLKFDDGLGRPIYLRVEVGTGPSPTYPDLKMLVGTATNGAGALVGPSITYTGNTANRDPVAGAVPSRLCCLPGYLAVSFGDGYLVPGSAACQFVLCRHQDLDGSPNDLGIHAVYSLGCHTSGTASNNAASITFAAGNTKTDGNYWAVASYGVTDLNVQGKVATLPVWYYADRHRVTDFCTLAAGANVSIDTDVSLKILGANPRNYRNIGIKGSGVSPSPNFYILVLWE